MEKLTSYQSRRRQTLGLMAAGAIATTSVFAQTSSTTINLPIGSGGTTPAPTSSVSLTPDASHNPLKDLPLLTDIPGAIPAPILAAKAWFSLDATSQQIIGVYNPDERIDPASITKIMTAYLVFRAIHEQRISLQQEIMVSPGAAATPGSRMFLLPNKPVSVENLIRGMIIQSGNDATVALAEAVGGTESGFVAQMNAEARRMGLTATNFMNASGLPDPQHYTSVRDLAWLAHQLILDFPQEYGYYKEKSFSWNGINQPNRNRLLFLDPTVDGFKTGHTDAAGFCLIASAVREGRRVITVVVGTANDAARAQESQKLLNWSFMNFESFKLFEPNAPVINDARVWKGSSSAVQLGSKQAIWVTVPKGQQAKVTASVERVDPIIAPVNNGQALGSLNLKIDDRLLRALPLVALDSVAGAGVFGRALDSMRMWFN